MNRFTKAIASTALVVGVMVAGLSATPKTTSADGTGQIEGGSAVYLIKNLTQGGAYADNVTATCNDELQYSIRLHNSGYVAVNNINVQVALPTAATTQNVSTAKITYSNGITPSTSDTTNVNFASAQSITYENGTTTLYNGSGALVGTQPDGITGSGINLGSLNGSTTEYVTIKAKINCAPTDVCPNIPGNQPTVPAGSTVDSNGNCVTPTPPVYTCDAFSIVADTNRTVRVTDFKTTANNGASFTYADIVWGDNTPNTSNGNLVGQTHQYAKDGTYTVTVTSHFMVNGVEKTVNSANCTKQITVKTDAAAPIYSCDLFTISASADRTVKITALNTTAKNGASFKNVVIDWGDSSTALTSTSPVGQTHQYGKDGSFTLNAVAHFTVNGEDKTATGAACTTGVTFTPNQPPVVTPPVVTPPTVTTAAAPTTLVNTGAGSVIGLFAVVTIAGSIAYRQILARRLSRQ